MRPDEHATKAEHSVGFAVHDLQILHANSEPMAEIVWRGLLHDAVQLRDRISQARQAMAD